jgi:hypothetical protein
LVTPGRALFVVDAALYIRGYPIVSIDLLEEREKSISSQHVVDGS